MSLDSILESYFSRGLNTGTHLFVFALPLYPFSVPASPTASVVKSSAQIYLGDQWDTSLWSECVILDPWEWLAMQKGQLSCVHLSSQFEEGRMVCSAKSKTRELSRLSK